MSIFRTRLRLARRLHDAWELTRRRHCELEDRCSTLAPHWSALERARHRYRLAVQHGLRSVLPSLDEDVRWQLDELVRAARFFQDRPEPQPEPPGPRDWLAELDALEREFGRLEILRAPGLLRVRTDAIRLHGVDLGPFAVTLDNCGRGVDSLAITALDPNPAAGRESVTHPHVNDGGLCAGNAARPIERALASGRIADAFLLVRSVLTTYNPRSAFVQLAEWEVAHCSECGGHISPDETIPCSACGGDLCDGCVGSCTVCETSRCGNCLRACDSCGLSCCPGCLDATFDGEQLCPDCRALCQHCDTLRPQGELNDEGLCGDCAAAAETPTEESHAT